jgi:hypothetical protein
MSRSKYVNKLREERVTGFYSLFCWTLKTLHDLCPLRSRSYLDCHNPLDSRANGSEKCGIAPEYFMVLLE